MRRNGAPRTLVILLAVGLAGLFLLRTLRFPAVIAPWSLAPTDRPHAPIYAAPGTEMTLTRVVGREDGKRQWEFKAKRIRRSLDGLVFTAEMIEEGRIYDQDRVQCTFRAGQARYEFPGRRIAISGGLTGWLADGESTFTAAEAEADLQANTLIIPVPVKVEGKEVNLTADRLTADLKGEIVTLSGHAVVVWSGGTIRAEEITYSVKDGTFSVGGTGGEGVELIL